MNKKPFKLEAHQIRDLARGLGGGIASDKIMRDGMRVQYMIRGESQDQIDSGWSFFSGLETQEYVDDPSNFAVYGLNTIANYDPDIIPFLRAPRGSVFERNDAGELVQVEGPSEEEAPLLKAFPVAKEAFKLTDRWSLVLPLPFNHRIENGSLVLWRPGITFWIDAFTHESESPEACMSELAENISRDATEIIDKPITGAVLKHYRLSEASGDATQESMTCLAASCTGHLLVAGYFDRPEHLEIVRRTLESIHYTPP